MFVVFLVPRCRTGERRRFTCFCGPNPDGTNHFTIVAKDLIDFEGSNVPGQTVINKIPSPGDAGNVLVTSPTGRIDVGPNVTINGTATAKTITFPSNGSSSIAFCVADVSGESGQRTGCALRIVAYPADFTAF